MNSHVFIRFIDLIMETIYCSKPLKIKLGTPKKKFG